jgi:hypothetical protein
LAPAIAARARRLTLAAPSHAITIRRAAEILGEDEDVLWDMATDMQPEHGCLWVYDINDQQIVAFTPTGMEYLRDMLPEYKRRRSSPRP